MLAQSTGGWRPIAVRQPCQHYPYEGVRTPCRSSVVMKPDRTATVGLNRDEIRFLLNAISETFEALEDWEFQTRTGFEPHEARDLREKLKSML